MKSYSKLFRQYEEGNLSDEKINELNQLLIEVYFNSPEDLNREEMEYTEDLVFEFHAKNKLEDKYKQKFNDKLNKDKHLLKKYNLLKDLVDTAGSDRSKRFQHKIETDINNEKEEAKLKGILQEVIEKVNTERETTKESSRFENTLAKLKAFFKDLIPPFNFAQPQVQLAMVMASVIILAVIVWVSFDPLKKELVSDNVVLDSLNNNQIADLDTVNLQQETEQNQLAEIEESELKKKLELKEMAKQERMSKLLAANYETPEFEFAMVRSQTSASDEEFVRAAENYNDQDYDSCILVLSDLLNKKFFKHPDTLNEIHFYLGNCYLTKGLKEKQKDLLELSLSSFKKVDAVYFAKEVKWYSALAYLELDRKKESKLLLDTLLRLNYPENIKAFRDSVEVVLQD